MTYTAVDLSSDWTNLVAMEMAGVGRTDERRAIERRVLLGVVKHLESAHAPRHYPAGPPAVRECSPQVLERIARTEPEAEVIRECREWCREVARIEQENHKRLRGVLWAVQACSALQADGDDEEVDRAAMEVVQFLRGRWGVDSEPPTDPGQARSYAAWYSCCPEQVCPAGYRRV